MEEFKNGDIITLRFDDERYIPGKILQIEPLTLHDIIHVRLYDILVAGGPGGYDNVGEYRDRVHNLSENITSRTPLFDSLAMTSTAFEDSDPVVVAFEDVAESELSGYSVWVARRREAAERRGMIRYDVEEEDYEIEDEEVADGETVEVESFEEDERIGDDSGVDEPTTEDIVEEIVIEVRPWHDAVYDAPLSNILRDLQDIMTSEPYDRTAVGQAIVRKQEEGESEIGGIVSRLVDDGDYAAGQELFDYGNRAVPHLTAALADAKDPQTVEDICQILADMGSDESYEALAHGMEGRLDSLHTDEGAQAAARSYLYAVMLTGGTAEPIKSRLPLIERMNHPDLKVDIDAAMAAMKDGGEEIPAEPQQRSSDPFGL